MLTSWSMRFRSWSENASLVSGSEKSPVLRM